MYSAAYVWAKVLAHMEERLTAPIVSAWFDDAEVVELTDTDLTIYTPSEFRREMILRKGAAYVQDALRELFPQSAELQNVKLRVLTEEEFSALRRGPESDRPLQFFEARPELTFEKFVVGPSNQFAHGAALGVANNPADAYNPLLIYGPSGLGKTHLLYAIAARVHEQHPEYNIVYVKGDQFTNELIEALGRGKNVEFRDKYRNADLFLMDDIHFIAGKESTQEEFFNTFNTLWEAHKQIVLTSDRPPKNMVTLEDRLRTRLEWGLLADIQPPDYETRMAIIQNKAIDMGLELTPDVCSYIAENITNNIRQIEGTVNKLRAYHELNHMVLDLPNVERSIKDMFIDPSSNSALPTPELIIGEVCRFYSMDPSVIRSTLKNKNTAEARQVAMYLIRTLTNLSLPEIGREFNRDHSTVIHALNKIDKDIKLGSTVLQENIRMITEVINSKL